MCINDKYKDLNEVRGQMVTLGNQVVRTTSASPKIGIRDCYGNKYKMLDGDVQRGHGV